MKLVIIDILLASTIYVRFCDVIPGFIVLEVANYPTPLCTRYTRFGRVLHPRVIP